MTTRSISIFLLVVGLLWGLIVAGFFALLGGFFGNNPPHDPELIGKGLLSVWWMFLGPLLLIVGAILLLGTHQRTGSILSLIVCAILTLMVGYQVISSMHDLADPLIARFYSYYALDAIAVVLTLLADAGAVQLYRLGAK
jgi:hypothetical protein